MANQNMYSGLQAAMHLKNHVVTVTKTFTVTGDSVAVASYPSSTGQYHLKSANSALSASDYLYLVPMPSSAQVIAGGITFSASSTSGSSMIMNLTYNTTSIATSAKISSASSLVNTFDLCSSCTINSNSASGNYLRAKVTTIPAVGDKAKFSVFAAYMVDSE
jgi:hypothetical protein